MPLGAPQGIVNSIVTVSGSVIFSQALLIKTAGGLMKIFKKNVLVNYPLFCMSQKKNQGSALNTFLLLGRSSTIK